jgi:hypothetical protein
MDFQGSLANDADKAILARWIGSRKATGLRIVAVKVVDFDDPTHFEVVDGIICLSPVAAIDLMESAAGAGAIVPPDIHLRN